MKHKDPPPPVKYLCWEEIWGIDSGDQVTVPAGTRYHERREAARAYAEHLAWHAQHRKGRHRFDITVQDPDGKREIFRVTAVARTTYELTIEHKPGEDTKPRLRRHRGALGGSDG